MLSGRWEANGLGRPGPRLPIHREHLKAVILDVDGTLYHQRPVRRAMFWRLLRACVRHPVQGFITLRVLRAYRRAQDALRAPGREGGDLSMAQERLAAAWTGVEPRLVRERVARWMEQESLASVARSVREGLLDFLQAARHSGLRLGVFSDYPPARKLEAMRVAHLFDVVVCAQDTDVQRFKPNPRGLTVALRRLGVEKHQALYVGDRPEVDAPAAHAAGIPCIIIGGRRPAVDGAAWFDVSGYGELTNAICDD